MGGRWTLFWSLFAPHLKSEIWIIVQAGALMSRSREHSKITTLMTLLEVVSKRPSDEHVFRMLRIVVPD